MKEVNIDNMAFKYEWNGSGYSWYMYRDKYGHREPASTEQIIMAQQILDKERGDHERCK